MLKLARRTLKLPHSRLLLHTSSLNICAGHAVTLSHDTWGLLKDLVGEISVSLSTATVLNGGEADGTCASLHSQQACLNVLIRFVTGNHDRVERRSGTADPGSSTAHENNGDASSELDLEAEYEEQEVEREFGSDDEHGEHEWEHDHAREEEEQEDDTHEEAPAAQEINEEARSIHQPVESRTPAPRAVKHEEGSLRSGSTTRAIESLPSSQPPPSSQDTDPAERLVLTITYRDPKPNGEDLEQMFKIRSTATVRSALKGACRTFNLDFERASLKLVVDGEEGGEESLFDCAPGDSMKRAGAVNSGKFVVIMEDE